MTVLIESARAKVNLTLRVLGRRTDGYHDIESVVAFADCADRLTLRPGTELSLSITGPYADACGETNDNLVMRAAFFLKERIPGLTLGSFTLDKHLPVAAGIGGGSADAAAALRLLARANDIDINDPHVVQVARDTGADIPVCLASHACTMTGVGENLSMLDLPSMPCVMVNPRVAVATKDVFKALGLKYGELRVGVVDVVQARGWPKGGPKGGFKGAASADEWLNALATGVNDLEPPALKVEPVIGEVLSALRAAAGARLARMSGSGATCFAIFASDADARRAAAEIAKVHPSWWVYAGTLS